MSGRLRPKVDAPPAADADDDLAGIEAFAPHAEGSPDDPFVKAFAETRVPRHLRAGSEVRSRAPRVGLVLAVLLLVCGVIAAVSVDGDDDRDVATTSPTSSSTTHRSTSTTARTSTTRGAPFATTATTAFDPFTMNTTSGGTGTTVRATGVTIRPLTTPTFPTTTLPPPNQGLTITFEVEPAAPAVGDDVTITLTYRDPDAPPTANCRTIDVDGARLFADPCSQPDCSTTGAAAGGGVGGATQVVFHTTFATAGDHQVTTYGQSVQPYCHDRYGDETTASQTIAVAAATGSTAPSTAPGLTL